MRILEKIAFVVCRVLAIPIALVELNDTNAHPKDNTVHKTRRWYGEGLVRFSNLLLRIMDSPIEVLPSDEWEAWERAISDNGVSGINKGVVLDRIAGQPLEERLRNANEIQVDPLLRTAFGALHRFHQANIVWKDKTFARSHGDASARNVLIDDDGNAVWFDFDARHRIGLPDTLRQADDLITLLVSTVATLGLERIERVAKTLHESYGNEAAIDEARRFFARPLRRSLPVKLAQGNISVGCFEALARCLSIPLNPPTPCNSTNSTHSNTVLSP